APLLTFYALRLGGQASTVGPLFSAFAVAQLLASPIWGRVSDRYGRRPVLLIGLLGSAIAYSTSGFANALWLLFVCRLVAGFGGVSHVGSREGRRVECGASAVECHSTSSASGLGSHLGLRDRDAGPERADRSVVALPSAAIRAQ